jgi:hypothetical protein
MPWRERMRGIIPHGRASRHDESDSDVLISTATEILCDGKRAKPLLEGLRPEELQELAEKLSRTVDDLSAPQKNDREYLIQWTIDAFNIIEARKTTQFVPGGSAEYVGTLKGGVSDLSSRMRGRQTSRQNKRTPDKDLILPKEKKHFIPPGEHWYNLGLQSYPEKMAAIISVLGEVYAKADENPNYSIEIDGNVFKVRDLIFYGRREVDGGGGKYMFYSDPVIGSYLAQQLAQQFNILPLKPKSTDLVRVDKFCTAYLHVNADNPLHRYTSERFDERIKTIVSEALSSSGELENFPGNPHDLIKFYRTMGSTNVLYLSPTLSPWIQEKLGLPPVLPAVHPHITSLHKKVSKLGMGPNRDSDLKKFLWRELLHDPDRIINPATGRTLKDSIFTYRAGLSLKRGIYLHDDLDGFLQEHWLAVKPHGEEGKSWLMGTALFKKFGIHIPAPPKTHEVSQELLEKIREIRGAEPIVIAGENKCVSDVVKRFSIHSAGIFYCIHKDALKPFIEKGWLTKAKMLERAEQIREDGPTKTR